jgi:hypothetical protein
MAESDIRTVRIPVQHAVQRASLGMAPWPVGKPTRTAGVHQRAEERKRRQQAVARHARPGISLDGHIVHQMQSSGDPSWSGSCHTLTADTTPSAC